MFAEATRESANAAYRLRLQALLGIPLDAPDQDVHELVDAGFSAAVVEAFCYSVKAGAKLQNQVISLRTLRARLAGGQRLTVHESDRLFRLAHIIAMAETSFGRAGKAHRWLSKPKDHFAGRSPFSILSTAQGTRLFEVALIQLTEGLTF